MKATLWQARTEHVNGAEPARAVPDFSGCADLFEAIARIGGITYRTKSRTGPVLEMTLLQVNNTLTNKERMHGRGLWDSIVADSAAVPLTAPQRAEL